MSWTRDEVDHRLHQIMKSIHKTCVEASRLRHPGNYVNGANIGGFLKVARPCWSRSGLRGPRKPAARRQAVFGQSLDESEQGYYSRPY